ncbi:aspartate aminotransferase family protein [Deinococcus peraridilitoris]|uniref:Adenosylmethionine-8-amino-7-oxononanoate aminotransferase n=1 Tax=Deinococcus peraridilitoris (strain DSM 19664 / LMG 22246 / CIP 109416 / KR-200) TaxID=937777 RepID=L0A7P4_DEIPD|nr:aspartate aminotransferase family protein [Deinococcus peraridilitoris]AFZ69075.1 adenosylmethionine-8-amino-7-oxononanoate aminotransferase [Deinococcus peraridilitoris DSM 19664]
MSSVFHRSAKTYPVAVRGQGVYLWDASGKRYLDGASGALVANIGHGHPGIADALGRQARALPFVHGSQFTSEIYERYAARLAGLLPQDGYRFWAVSGGSEAVESAIKLARQYHTERGESGRYRIVTRKPSYHGASLGALAASGMGARRALYRPLLNEDAFPKIPRPDPRVDGEQDARQLETLLLQLGPESVAAFIAEPVVGASDAALSPAAGYYQEVQRICARHGVLFIADEVMCGLGRAGSMFALSQWHVTPDLLVLGKGLAAGYAPLAGVLAAPHVHAAVMEGSGAFKHGFTYAGHPISLAAGDAVLEVIEQQNLVERSRCAGDALLAGLRDLAQDFSQILEVRGRGLMLGLVLGDPDTREAYDDPGLAERLGRAAFAHGLITYPGSGALDGRRGDHLLLGPPLNATDRELDELLSLLRVACTETLTGRTHPA